MWNNTQYNYHCLGNDSDKESPKMWPIAKFRFIVQMSSHISAGFMANLDLNCMWNLACVPDTTVLVCWLNRKTLCCPDTFHIEDCLRIQYKTEHIRTEQNRIEQNISEQNRTEQIRIKQNISEQNRTEKNKTYQNRTEQNRTEQNRTEHNRTYQNKTEHIRTKQNRSEHII